MDVVDIGAAIALAKNGGVLPATTAGDAGEALIVGADGAWTKGEITGAAITVSGTTLTISGGE